MATEQSVFGDITLNISKTTNLQCEVSGLHQYSDTGTGGKPWQLACYLDGTVIGFTGGSGAITDTPNMQAVFNGITTGTHTLKVTWFGHTSMRFSGGVCAINFFYK